MKKIDCPRYLQCLDKAAHAPRKPDQDFNCDHCVFPGLVNANSSLLKGVSLRPTPEIQKEVPPMSEPIVKECTRCRAPFPLTNDFFARDSRAPNGFRSECKNCSKATKITKTVVDSQKSPKRKYIRRIMPGNLRKKGEASPLLKASPEAILRALKRGFAQEMIQLIEQTWLKES